MTIRSLAAFAVAILLGILSLLGVREVLNARRADASIATGAQRMTPVVVASIPIERGTSLKPVMLKTVSYPQNSVPAGAFQSIDQAIATGDRMVLRSLAVNEPVLLSKLSGPNNKANLSGTLRPGMRAVSVRSSDVTGVGGFVLPGDRVDIYVTRAVAVGEDASTITQVIAENAMVLGVDQTSDQESEKPIVSKSVTVEVTPEQASAIALGQAVGLITLSLRQLGDQAELPQKIMTVNQLTAMTPVSKALAPVKNSKATPKSRMRKSSPAPEMINVIRGTDVSNYSIGS
jgi:pilus assembly protein CpaB